jgi:hypothetical protein
VPATRKLSKDEMDLMFSQGDTLPHGNDEEEFLDEDENQGEDETDDVSTPKKTAAGYIRMPVKSLKNDMWNIVWPINVTSSRVRLLPRISWSASLIEKGSCLSQPRLYPTMSVTFKDI